MKIYVATKALPFKPEQYLFVKASRRDVEKELRRQFPHMKADGKDSFYETNGNETTLLFVHEEEI